MKHLFSLFALTFIFSPQAALENNTKKTTPPPKTIANPKSAVPQVKKSTPPLSNAKIAVAKIKQDAIKKKEGFINIQDPFEPTPLPKICCT